MYKYWFIFSLAFSTYAHVSYSQKENIKISQSINLDGYNLTFVSGNKINNNKLTVIDFWATWCGPCIEAFPHLEKVQKKYGEKINIIAISDEKISVVRNFLKKRPYSLTFYNDTTKALFKQFNVEARPLTILVASDKKFIWVGSSDGLENVLDDYFTGKDIDYSVINANPFQKKYLYSSTNINALSEPLFKYSLRRSESTDNYAARPNRNDSKPADIMYSSFTILEIVQDYTNTPLLRIKCSRKDIDTTHVNIDVKSTTPAISGATAWRLVMDQLQSIFNFKIVSKTESVPVYVLKMIDKTKLNSYRNDIEGGGTAKQTKEGGYNLTRLKLGQIAQYLEARILNKIVVLDSNIDVKEAYDITFDNGKDVESLKNQLESKYGLTLKADTADIQFTIIE
jgi:thiol-disulfide isomerase/thioredoxin